METINTFSKWMEPPGNFFKKNFQKKFSKKIFKKNFQKKFSKKISKKKFQKKFLPMAKCARGMFSNHTTYIQQSSRSV